MITRNRKGRTIGLIAMLACFPVIAQEKPVVTLHPEAAEMFEDSPSHLEDTLFLLVQNLTPDGIFRPDSVELYIAQHKSSRRKDAFTTIFAADIDGDATITPEEFALFDRHAPDYAKDTMRRYSELFDLDGPLTYTDFTAVMDALPVSFFAWPSMVDPTIFDPMALDIDGDTKVDEAEITRVLTGMADGTVTLETAIP